MCLLLQGILRIKRYGLFYCRTPCNAHVWVASGATKKSKQKPRGDMSQQVCKDGNCIASRSALGCLLAVSRSVFWAMEQPGSSVLPYLAEMRWLVDKPTRVSVAVSYRIRLPLGCSYVGPLRI